MNGLGDCDSSTTLCLWYHYTLYWTGNHTKLLFRTLKGNNLGKCRANSFNRRALYVERQNHLWSGGKLKLQMVNSRENWVFKDVPLVFSIFKITLENTIELNHYILANCTNGCFERINYAPTSKRQLQQMLYKQKSTADCSDWTLIRKNDYLIRTPVPTDTLHRSVWGQRWCL